jgi:DNA-binding CsgD family transcriptional regulator
MIRHQGPRVKQAVALATEGLALNEISARMQVSVKSVKAYLYIGGAERLCPRMQQAIDLATQGLANKEIAARMHLSEGSVKGYLSVAGAGSRYELMGNRIRELEQQNRDLTGTPAGAD